MPCSPSVRLEEGGAARPRCWKCATPLRDWSRSPRSRRGERGRGGRERLRERGREREREREREKINCFRRFGLT